MADAGLFVGFGQPVRGREQQSLVVFNEAFQLYGSLQQQGEIDDFDAVILEPHGGDLGGFFLLRGDRAKLEGVRGRDDFQRLSIRAGLIVENLGVVGGTLGDGIASQMAVYQEQIADLAT